MSLPDSVAPALARALAHRGYDTLTPVQEAVLAPDLAHADLVVSAQTGSGKTVAFGLTLAPALLESADRFGPAGAPLALVIAPTRELALQVRRELEWLYAPADAVIASCVGGMDARSERRALERGAHIVVGTPGRLADHIRREALVLSGLRAVVLDEADEMLDLGFREELEFILEASPAERRTLMFSATMPKAIEALARKYQRDAKRVNTVGAETQHGDIDHRAVVAARHEVENAVFNLLRYHDATNALVFCGTRAGVTRMTSRLSNRGYSVVALSGELSQNERMHALQALRDHRAQVCVATDVAARGIDLPDLDLVIHADLPRTAEALVHRSGRTGRAGKKGVSVLVVPHPARRQAERLLREARIEARWGEPPTPEDVQRRDDTRLLSDPLLSEPAAEDHGAIVARLVADRTPEQIAAAFVRLYRKGMAAPEEIAPPPEAPRAERSPRREREDFSEGVWVRLSVGRAQAAEPRWLIPMLCRVAGLTKRDLGAIRIHEFETHVEFAPEAAARFFAAIGPEGQVEKHILAAPLDGGPDATPEAPRRRSENRRERRAKAFGTPVAVKPRTSSGPKRKPTDGKAFGGKRPQDRKKRK